MSFWSIVLISSALCTPLMSLAQDGKQKLKEALKNDFFETCYYLNSRYQAKAIGCEGSILEAVCSQKAFDLDDALNKLMASSVIRDFAKRGGDELKSSLETQFLESAQQCLQPHDGNNLPENFVEKSPEEAAKEFWRDNIRILARAISSGTMTYAKTQSFTGVSKTLSKNLLAGICDLTLETMQGFLENPKVDWNKDQCVEASKGFRKSQLKPCLGTAKSLCRISGGFVTLSKWPLLESENQIVGMIEDFASVGIETVCKGVGASALCGTIDAAILQIGQYFKTGTNDWAECSNISQISLCIGQTIGAGGGFLNNQPGWVNNSGVSEPYFDKNLEEVARHCCRCSKKHYEDHWYGGEFYQWQDYLGVIQKTDFRTSNCNYPGGKPQGTKFFDGSTHNGYASYYTYSGCRRQLVTGNKCSFYSCDDQGNCKRNPFNFVN